MLHVLLCKNVIPSFPKGQATRRGPHSSPTFAMGFRPFFPMPGGRIGAPLPGPAGFRGERGFLGQFRLFALRRGSKPRRFRHRAGGNWTRSSGRGGRSSSFWRCRNNRLRAERITPEKFAAVPAYTSEK